MLMLLQILLMLASSTQGGGGGGQYCSTPISVNPSYFDHWKKCKDNGQESMETKVLQ